MVEGKNTMTRKGKIARLPKVIREELNRRLDDGWLHIRLVAWLNGLPEVKEILDRQFGGRAITPQNLSVWKAGGYQDWVKWRQRMTGMLPRSLGKIKRGRVGEVRNSEWGRRVGAVGYPPVPRGGE